MRTFFAACLLALVGTVSAEHDDGDHPGVRIFSSQPPVEEGDPYTTLDDERIIFTSENEGLLLEGTESSNLNRRIQRTFSSELAKEGMDWVQAEINGINLVFSSNPWEGVILPEHKLDSQERLRWQMELLEYFNEPNSDSDYNLSLEELDRLEELTEKRLEDGELPEDEETEWTLLQYKNQYGEQLFTRAQRAAPIWITAIVLAAVCCLINVLIFCCCRRQTVVKERTNEPATHEEALPTSQPLSNAGKDKDLNKVQPSDDEVGA